MDDQRNRHAEVERSRGLREKADETRGRFGKVMHELLHAEAAKRLRLAADAEELRARMRAYSLRRQDADRSPPQAHTDAGDRRAPSNHPSASASPCSPDT